MPIPRMLGTQAKHRNKICSSTYRPKLVEWALI
jgi:hypothetical protein